MARVCLSEGGVTGQQSERQAKASPEGPCEPWDFILSVKGHPGRALRRERSDNYLLTLPRLLGGEGEGREVGGESSWEAVGGSR